MKDTSHFKKVLEEEFAQLKNELSKMGTQKTEDPAEWDVKTPDMDIMSADDNEVADRAEELHINSIILDELAVRFANVDKALKKLEEGTYGLCETCGDEIEEERLKANPVARTCREHIGEEHTLLN